MNRQPPHPGRTIDEGRERILIVDDEESVLRVFRKILSKNNYMCATALDGGEARKRLEDEPFDLMLCDIRMPGESGLDLTSHVRISYPNMGVIIVTGVDDPETARITQDMGVYGYLTKPCQPNQLLISVANALRRRELEEKEKIYLQSLEYAVAERTADLVSINEKLKEREAELEARQCDLQEVNSALRVLLKKREEDRGVLEDKVIANVKRLIEPYLKKLFNTGMNAEQCNLLGILEKNLDEIVSPFARDLSTYQDLTPTELQVANLIKQGKRTKEIAQILNLSVNTIKTHRFKIRTKLGLKNSPKNLTSHLTSLQR